MIVLPEVMLSQVENQKKKTQSLLVGGVRGLWFKAAH